MQNDSIFLSSYFGYCRIELQPLKMAREVFSNSLVYLNGDRKMELTTKIFCILKKLSPLHMIF